MINKINDANIKASGYITAMEPYWVDVKAAKDVLEGFDENTILHSGPPVEYENMCKLHKQGMINGVIFEGWAKNKAEAEKMILSGKVKIDSAMNYNTVGSGTGIITKSVPLLVVEDRNTGKKAGVFPAEGRFGGGFCGWGVYSNEIGENLHYMRERLFKPICEILKKTNGIYLKSIIADGLNMGDENHSSQSAVDLLFLRDIIPYALECSNYKALILYFAQTNRFFHNFGQAAVRSGIINADGVKYSTMVTAAGGNGVEYGIKIAGIEKEWFTAPSPMIKGRYMAEGASIENQLPWIGDSSIVECGGLGGIASAASPKVCSYRGESLVDGINVTKAMNEISITKNKNYKIANMDYEEMPSGIDAMKVVSKKILPVINGGMIDKNGGWLGAGCTEIPLECFEKAIKRYKEIYKCEKADLL